MISYDCTYLCFVFTASALKCLLLHVCNGNESTEVTHIDLIGIGGSVESLVKELGSTMSYLTITFHLTKTQTSITNEEIESQYCMFKHCGGNMIMKCASCSHKTVTYRDRPSIGCLVRIWTGPLALE